MKGKENNRKQMRNKVQNDKERKEWKVWGETGGATS